MMTLLFFLTFINPLLSTTLSLPLFSFRALLQRVEVGQENNITIIHGGLSFHDSVVILSPPPFFHLSITGITSF